ncbi:carbohydrate-binding-like protein [Scleroderma citrinum]
MWQYQNHSMYDLEELTKKKFGLEPTDIEFYSSCMNLCEDLPARIDSDVWEHVMPYIGCITVTQKSAQSTYAEGSGPTSDTTVPREVMTDSDISDVVDEFTTAQNTSNTLDGHPRISQWFQDFLQVEPLPGSPSDVLEKSSNSWAVPSATCCSSVDMTSSTPRQEKYSFTSVSVQFNVHATTSGKENIYLTGSIPELKNWNTTSAILMSRANYPIWSTTVELPADHPIEYKYIRKRESPVTWLSDANNAFRTVVSGLQTLDDTWR